MSRWTGIPIATLREEDKDKLIHLRDRLHDRVIGQDEAVNLVAQAVMCSRAGLDQPSQPIGSFLFLGPSGIGKTELAKALAEQLFNPLLPISVHHLDVLSVVHVIRVAHSFPTFLKI